MHILKYFLTKLHYFAKFRMLFPAVLINIPNSKVCLKGEWSIEISVYIRTNINWLGQELRGMWWDELSELSVSRPVQFYLTS